MAITNGYTTVAEYIDYAHPNGGYDTKDDAIIESIIEGASRFIDAQTRRTFYARTETHYFSVPDGRRLDLDDELLTVTTLTNGDGTVLTTSDYYLWPRNKPPYSCVVMKESSLYYWTLDGSGNSEYVITLAGTWGYAATAPDDIRIACLDIAKSIYKRRFGENQSGVATITGAGVVITPRDIPETAAALLRAYRRLL